MAYGLEILGPDNSTVVVGPSNPVCNLAIDSAFSLAIGATQDFSCAGAQNANQIVTIVDTGSRLGNELVTVTRLTDVIRLTNTSTTSSYVGTLTAIRIR